MIVIDNSVLIAAFFEPGPRGLGARDLMQSNDMVAPELLDVEAVHTVRGLVRARKTTLARAGTFLADLPLLEIERVPHRILLARMWELRDNLTAYDATYVALAERLGATLVTGDAAMVQAPGIRCAVDLLS
ncbi:MAG: putative nucleic acid-binding protein contains domain [Marmoricola sp.]|nr:putative nucleic acid-binding protein contains domain [Marmoricola sp.]